MDEYSEDQAAEARPAAGTRPRGPYPRKTSFYQPGPDADRMRAAFVHTIHHTGIPSLSEFINKAVGEMVADLEREHNNGRPWEPRAAGEIPQGKPKATVAGALAAVRAIQPVTKEPTVPQEPNKHLVEIVEKLRTELDEIQVFYNEDGKSVMVGTHNHRDDVDDFRYFVYKQPWLPIEVFTYNYVRWEHKEDIELPES